MLPVGAARICTKGGPRACTATIKEFMEDLVLSETVTWDNSKYGNRTY
jgi:hypothetical protein